MPLLFSVQTARDLGAKEIGLVVPYLSYMRQDKRFKTGEGVTSEYFGQMLSQYFDWMITLEPHLHRHRTMNEIYSMLLLFMPLVPSLNGSKRIYLHLLLWILMKKDVANGPLVHWFHLDIGVPLFFTLSGFLFFLIAANQQSEISYWKFIYNRFLRIYLLVIFLFFISITIMDNFTSIDFFNLFGLNLPGNERTSWMIGDWGYQYLSFNWWTIGVEFIFYLAFPFLYKFYKKKGISYLISLALLIVAFKYGVYYSLLNEHGWKKSLF